MEKQNKVTPQFVEFLRRTVEQKRLDAGYSGSWGDNGASDLEVQIEIYFHGMVNSFPHQWDDYYKAYMKETDPEYEKYLELKERFE
jgi:hypothetical protein